MTNAERKEALRKSALARRMATDAARHTSDSLAVTHLIEGDERFRAADRLFLYAPVRGELDLTPLVDAARARGIPVAYPRIDGDGHMSYYECAAGVHLVAGAFGIPAPPAAARRLDPTPHTLLLLPALMGDLLGYRLGYGGGYFDRYLPAFAGYAVGVLSAEELVPALPVEKTDIPVAAFVTPVGWRYPS